MTEPLDTSLGEFLRQKRQGLNMEIFHISAHLKIKARDIEAIENEKWDNVTNHLYKPGLIRSYAKILKIDAAIIEREIQKLPLESNIKNQKHRLLNIGEEIDITPNREMFFNFLLISVLLFLVLFAIYNWSEKKTDLLTNQDLINQLEKVDLDAETEVLE